MMLPILHCENSADQVRRDPNTPATPVGGATVVRPMPPVGLRLAAALLGCAAGISIYQMVQDGSQVLACRRRVGP